LSRVSSLRPGFRQPQETDESPVKSNLTLSAKNLSVNCHSCGGNRLILAEAGSNTYIRLP
jgi:hypothetical protein